MHIDLAQFSEASAHVISDSDDDTELDYRWEEVENSATEAAKIDPDNLTALVFAGFAAKRRGRDLKAISWAVTATAKIALWNAMASAPAMSIPLYIVKDIAPRTLNKKTWATLYYLCGELGWDRIKRSGPTRLNTALL